MSQKAALVPFSTVVVQPLYTLVLYCKVYSSLRGGSAVCATVFQEQRCLSGLLRQTDRTGWLFACVWMLPLSALPRGRFHNYQVGNICSFH